MFYEGVLIVRYQLAVRCTEWESKKAENSLKVSYFFVLNASHTEIIGMDFDVDPTALRP